MFIRSERPDLFQLRNVSDVEDNSALRWVVDDHADLMLMRKLYNVLDLGTNLVTYRQLVAEVKSRPELASDDSVGQTWDPASVNK